MKLTFILLSTFLLFFSLSCTAVETDADRTGFAEINVVSTIYPLADIIGRLGGEKVNSIYLLPAGASPHTYEPTVEQARQVNDAHLFVYIGAGLDDWAAQLASAADSELIMVNLSENVLLLDPVPYHSLENGCGEDSCSGHDHNHDHNCDHDHSSDSDHGCGNGHGQTDPHFWLDPLIVRDAVCPLIYEQLSALLPAEEEYFQKMLEQYQHELTALHVDIEKATAGFEQNKFISFHSAWQYFARRYNLQEVAVIASFPGQEPSAGWMAELLALIRNENIGAILAEPQFSSALAERLAEESGSLVLFIDPLGGEDMPGRETYLDLMRFNLDIFQQALQ